MHITDDYRISILPRCNPPLWWFPNLLLVSFPSALHLHSKSPLIHIRPGGQTVLTRPEIRRPSRSPLPTTAPQNPEPLSPGGGWGYNFQNLPSTHVEEPPTAPVIPTALSFKSKKALSNVSGTPGSSKYATPTQTTTRPPGQGSRNRRPQSETSSDDEVSSGMSSDNSLVTPPVQAGRLLTPIYGPVGLPPAAPGTGRTAPVVLPTHTPGTGRTNPVNLPSNGDGMPPPGMVNEPPAPTPATRGRGGAANNRGRKRR